MDSPDIAEQDTIPAGTDSSDDAPWGINPRTGRPYTSSPEDRAATGARLADARRAKAAARQAAGPDGPTEAPDLSTPIDRSTPDRAPSSKKRRARTAAASSRGEKQEDKIPAFRAGPIAKGMNKLYVKAGKIVRLINQPIGESMIAITRKESEDDVTVGEAWEEIARTHPQVRVWLLRMVAGGAWGQLFWAHAPVLLAVVMLDSVRNWIPFPDLVDALLSGDDDQPPAGVPTGADLQQMMTLAQQMMGPLLAQRTAGAPVRTPPEESWPPGEQDAA